MAKINKFIIEGLDRLGKSTLVQNIQEHLGYFQVIHYGKPQTLNYYEEGAADSPDVKQTVQQMYQMACFRNMFKMLNTDGVRMILDRAHLGECVYSPIYRKYEGDYVYGMEELIADRDDIRLILLTEDFSASKHFKDDGLSFDVSKRNQEQQLFIKALFNSNIKDKRMICVTGLNGEFRPEEDILREALQ